MEKEGTDGAALPPMGGGGAPIPEENQTRMIGRLTRKPFVTEVTGGHKKALFTLMVPRSFSTSAVEYGRCTPAKRRA